ncbi:MAG: prepilin-type N-terminal cleavage/methylation domain-containing protein [Gammaproteobacteria bacterium]|nr:prepilin-type N-terminal cleavage/methylation domain-containing protein [Gammaproteobacteria bacterium]
MQSTQKGFTLIELMIVVAIIGILAAIATAQYQRFIAKSQVAEGLNLLGGVKAVIEYEWAQSAEFPSDAQLSNWGVKNSGIYVDSINSDVANKQISALFKSTGTSGLIKNKTIVFEQLADGSWSCQVTPSSIDVSLLPSVCE